VVGLVYNFVLRSLWDPQGIQWAVDEMLHSVLPVLFVVYWWLFVAVRRLRWKTIPGWMLYPLFYCVFVMMRGASSGFYPYPFLDPVAVGYREVMWTIGGMILLFFVVALALVWISKILRKRLMLKDY
jgi:hypothetical protein